MSESVSGGVWIDFEDEKGDRWFPTREAMVEAMLEEQVEPRIIAEAMAEREPMRWFATVKVPSFEEPLMYPVDDIDAGIEFVLRYAESSGVDPTEAMMTLESQKMEGLVDLTVGPFRIYGT